LFSAITYFVAAIAGFLSAAAYPFAAIADFLSATT